MKPFEFIADISYSFEIENSFYWNTMSAGRIFFSFSRYTVNKIHPFAGNILSVLKWFNKNWFIFGW